MSIIQAPTSTYAWPWMPLTPGKLIALNQSLRKPQVLYGFGSKAIPLGIQAPNILRLDCSGYVRWSLYHALGQPVGPEFAKIPDGSVAEHYNWVEKVGFKKSSFDAGHNKDGAVRIAFLDPSDTSEHIGHVVLVVNGMTLESHGSVGVDSREWGSKSWMPVMEVYVLTPPPSA